MTELSMTVREYLGKAEIDLDGDFVQQAAQLMAQAAMELEVEQQIGAARHERTPARNDPSRAVLGATHKEGSR